MDNNTTGHPQFTPYDPHYYADYAIQVRDAITAWGLNYNRGCVIKYVVRAGKKESELDDLRKALNFLKYEIGRLENEISDNNTDRE